MQYFGEIAKEYVQTPPPSRDKMFGIREKEGLYYYIGNKQATIADNNIITDNEKFKGTPGLWKLIMAKKPIGFTDKDYSNYKRLMIKTNALRVGNKPDINKPRSSKSYKWTKILSLIWYGRKEYEKEYEGKGVVVIPSDPNALLERLDLLLASKEAGHTGVENELVSICDKLKRQGVLDLRSYKKLNSVIKK